jgi:hypothetical protein
VHLVGRVFGDELRICELKIEEQLLEVGCVADFPVESIHVRIYCLQSSSVCCKMSK